MTKNKELKREETIKECPTCNTLKISSPTPSGDEICPSCGDRECLDYEGVEEMTNPPVSEKYAGNLCGDSICPKCKVTIPMEEGVLFHYQIFHPRTKWAAESRRLNKKWK